MSGRYFILLYKLGHEKVARLPFCTCLVIFSLALLCILRRVSEQLVNSRAVTMLRYTRCNIVILIAATAWLMLSFSSCVVCGFDSYTVLFDFSPSTVGRRRNFLRRTLEKRGIRIRSAHDTRTEGH